MRLPPQPKAIPQPDPAVVFAASIPRSGQGRTPLLRVTWFWNLALCVPVAGDTDTSQTQPLREQHVLESELSVGGGVLLRLGDLGCPRELCGLIPTLQRGN